MLMQQFEWAIKYNFVAKMEKSNWENWAKNVYKKCGGLFVYVVCCVAATEEEDFLSIAS
jgi:hypothetical protein